MSGGGKPGDSYFELDFKNALPGGKPSIPLE